MVQIFIVCGSISSSIIVQINCIRRVLEQCSSSGDFIININCFGRNRCTEKNTLSLNYHFFIYHDCGGSTKIVILSSKRQCLYKFLSASALIVHRASAFKMRNSTNGESSSNQRQNNQPQNNQPQNSQSRHDTIISAGFIRFNQHLRLPVITRVWSLAPETNNRKPTKWDSNEE
ncbi:uncharacterized protein LOC113557961 [Rhopalosiphum maidis]|uniref:uncharacterized protein LOC113557961 n=1 Tax=Rhopalosiphum maidis TaxID=43146 RepID=UPI000F001231|nr:uncharacterized protein LOC113557961 [Rhopalosiphum maidis]